MADRARMAPEDLADVAERAVGLARDAGAHQAEAFCTQSLRLSARMSRGSISSCESVDDEGIAVRVFIRGAQGFAFTQDLSDEAVSDIARRAVSLAECSQEDPDFKSLPRPEEECPQPKTHDPEIAHIRGEDLAEWLSAMNLGAKDVADDVRCTCSVQASETFLGLANSLGVRRTGSGTDLEAFVEASVERDGEVASYFEYSEARRLADFNPETLGTLAAESALRFLGKKAIETETMDLILGPLAARSLYESVASAADADSIQRNRSYLCGKRGSAIGSAAFGFSDVPDTDWGLHSSGFDAEGAPRKTVELVREGRLEHHLHNSYTAGKSGEQNNGRASRGGYKSLVAVGTTNIVPKLGDFSTEELIGETKRGLYMPEGGFFPNPVSGEISATVDFGFIIEDGKIGPPVKNSMIGGRLEEFLQRTDAVSAEGRAEPGTLWPAVRIRGVRVAGAK